jgi:hypothetical protein
MVEMPPAAEQTDTRAQCPVHRVLSSVDTVQLILDFAGAGQWLFLSTVDSVFLECYKRVACESMAATFPQAKHVVSHINITLYSEVMASSSRVRLAHACGLNFRTPSNLLQRHVSLFAPLQTLVTAYELELLLTATMARGAAVANKLSVLIWLREKGTCEHTAPNKDQPAGCLLPPDITSYAAAHGHVHMLLWLQQAGFKLDEAVCAHAAHAGQLRVLQLLHKLGCPFDESVCVAAARAGQLEAVQFLLEHDCPGSAEAVDAAAESGKLPLLQLVLDTDWGEAAEETVSSAAACGHTHIVQYLRSEGCSWDTSACTSAATGGHLSTLRWLRDNGCPWDADDVCLGAASSGSVDVLAYMQQQGELVSAELLTKMLQCAGAHRRLAAVQWLRQQGAEWPTVLRNGKKPWTGVTLLWARAQGCTSPTSPP